MATLTFNKFDSFVAAIANKLHNLGTDTLKVVLSSAAPSASNTKLSDITQIAAGNGYTIGGLTTTQTSSAQVSGTYKLVTGDVTWTATGTMGTFRYITLYNDTASNDEVIGWWDYGSNITLNSGDSFVFDFDASNGVLTIA